MGQEFAECLVKYPIGSKSKESINLVSDNSPKTWLNIKKCGKFRVLNLSTLLN